MPDLYCAGVSMDVDSDVDLEAVVGPYLGIETDDEIWDSLGIEALEVPSDVPEWHTDWMLVPYVAPEPPFIECLPRGVDTRVFAEFVLAVRDAGWQAGGPSGISTFMTTTCRSFVWLFSWFGTAAGTPASMPLP